MLRRPGAQPGTLVTSRAASTSATCFRWAHSLRAAGCLGCRTGSSSGSGSASFSASARGGSCGCSTRCLARPRGVEHLIAGLASRSTRMWSRRQPDVGVPARVRGGCRGCCWRAPRRPAPSQLAVARRAGAAGRRLRRRRQRGRDGVDLGRPHAAALYEVVVGSGAEQAALGFAWRGAVASLATSLWWIGGVIGSVYGANFLPYIEQPGTIWDTSGPRGAPLRRDGFSCRTSVSGSRVLVPVLDDQRTMLFSRPVVVASRSGPGGRGRRFVWTRGSRLRAISCWYAPSGRRRSWRRGVPRPDAASSRPDLRLRPRRASVQSCAPPTGRALARRRPGVPHRGRGGQAWSRLRGRSEPAPDRDCRPSVLALAASRVGHRQGSDHQVSPKRFPTAWRAAARGLDRELPRNSRAIVLPARCSRSTPGAAPSTRSSGAVQAARGRAHRGPLCRSAATDLLWTVDGLVHQGRLVPGQLAPLLSLMGVRQVVTGTDDDLARSDAPPPADAASELAAQGLARPARSYGPASSFSPSGVGPTRRLAQVRRYDLPRARGIVRVEPTSNPIVVDGSADTFAGLAAFGALPSTARAVRGPPVRVGVTPVGRGRGAMLVISDSNRRQAFVPQGHWTRTSVPGRPRRRTPSAPTVRSSTRSTTVPTVGPSQATAGPARRGRRPPGMVSQFPRGRFARSLRSTIPSRAASVQRFRR